jgi:hypothetical protein
VQAAEHDLAAAAAIPARQVEGAVGESQVDSDADDFGQGRTRRRAVEEVLVPVTNLPVRRGGGGEAGQGESGGEDMLAEAGIRIFPIEGIDQKRVARLDRAGWERGVQPRRAGHIVGAPAGMHSIIEVLYQSKYFVSRAGAGG